MRLRSALRPFLLAGLLTVFAAALATVLLPASIARADVNDFSYSSWDAQYEIGLDDEGRALMQVTETLVADFPETDQNRGIVRGLPQMYGAAPLYPTVLSVTDENGRDVPYETDDDDDVLFVSIDDDTFKHGATTYVIEYTMRDVFHTPDDADIDEFYWDLLPLDSTQDIDRFTGGIRFDPSLTEAMIGEPSCYQGRSGATDACSLTEQDSGFAVTATDLAAGEGITVAFPFTAGTVTPSPALQPDPLTDAVPYAVSAGALLAAGGGLASIALMKRRHRAQGRGVIIAQYDVPIDLPPLLAGEIEGRRAKAVPAEIVHLGVRGALRIEAGTAKPVLTLISRDLERDRLDGAALLALFPDGQSGTRVDLATPDGELAARMAKLPTTSRAAATGRGLIESTRSTAAVVCGIVAIAIAVVATAMTIPGLVVQRPAAIAAFVLSLLIGVVVIVVSILLMRKVVVLTPAGAETREYLLGVREYIRLAEADRIRMLQSYSGAERRDDGGADVIVLYERLLPYAMLFDMEKEWAEVLELQYRQHGYVPNWYAGYAIGSLGSSLSRLGTSLSATPAATSSSSSSGSFGGGFSGGGGGGGFSGGR